MRPLADLPLYISNSLQFQLRMNDDTVERFLSDSDDDIVPLSDEELMGL